ncbi:MAG: hypothetical protein VYE22_07940 [Myxococcota bacterium]|nr:hypothetical protein [Myxococcota bacterium]
MSDSIDGFIPDEAEDEEDAAPTRAEPVSLPASLSPFDESTFEDETTEVEPQDDPPTAPSPFGPPSDTGIRAVTGRLTKPLTGPVTRPAKNLPLIADEVEGEEEAETVMNYVDPLAEPEDLPTAMSFAAIGEVEPSTQVEALPAPPMDAPPPDGVSGFRPAPPPRLPAISPPEEPSAQPMGRAVLIMVGVGVLSLILGLGGGVILWVAMQ